MFRPFPPQSADPARPGLAAAARLLRRGGALAFPTETYYALGCLAANAGAVARIYQVKGRPVHKPLPLLAGDWTQAAEAADLSALPRALAAFWPGPLTVLLPARPGLAAPLHDARGRIALRVTPHPLAAALAREAGGVITATSANMSGRPPARMPEDLDAALLRALAAGNAALPGAMRTLPPLLTGGAPCAGGRPSTIVEVLPGGLHVVRQGAVPAEKLLAAGFNLS